MSSTATARQLEYQLYSEQDETGSQFQTASRNASSLRTFEQSRTGTSTTPLPQFGGLPRQGIYADMARQAGRVNAAGTSDNEYERLLDERQRLLDKKFEGVMTKKESARLELVRWSLDRIEDARSGYALDALERAIERYERFGLQLQDFYAQLQQQVPRKRK